MTEATELLGYTQAVQDVVDAVLSGARSENSAAAEEIPEGPVQGASDDPTQAQLCADQIVADLTSGAVVEGRYTGNIASFADAIVGIVESERATFQLAHLRAEIDRAVRTHDIAARLPVGHLDQVLDDVLAAVLTECDVVALDATDVDVPAALLRSDGTSQYATPGACLFSTGQSLRPRRTWSRSRPPKVPAAPPRSTSRSAC